MKVDCIPILSILKLIRVTIMRIDGNVAKESAMRKLRHLLMKNNSNAKKKALNFEADGHRK